MICRYIHNGITFSETAYKTLLGHLITQYGAEVDVTSVLNTLSDESYGNELKTSPRLQGKDVDGEIKYDSQTKQPVSEKEYTNFIDKGTISNNRIENLISKVQRGQHLTPREQIMFYHNLEVAVDFFDGAEIQESSPEVDVVDSLNNNYTADEINYINELITTEEFQDYMSENDIFQPDIQEILRYYNEQRAKNLKIDNDTLIQINLLLSRTPFETVDELYAELHSMFYNGQVRQLNLQKLEESTLFNTEEKHRIANSLILQSEIGDTILAIGYDLSNEQTSKLTDLNRIEVAQELLVLNPSETSNGLTKTLDPGQVFNELAEELAGVATMESLESKIQNIEYDHIKQQFRENADFREFMFNLFSQLERIPIFQVADGHLVEASPQITQRETIAFLQQGLIGNAPSFIEAINRALNLGEEVWIEQIEQIQTLIKATEEIMTSFGIDIIGLHKEIGRAELSDIVHLLFQAKNLAESFNGAFMLDNVESFVEAYNRVFQSSTAPQFTYTRMSENMKNFATVQVSNPLSQIEMFSQFGLIKIGENTYHRVQRGENIEDAYAQAVQVLREGHFWLPPSALPGFLTKNNKISIRKLQDTTRLAEITRLVKAHIAQQMDSQFIKGSRELVEEMTLWSQVYGYEIETESILDKMQLLNNFDGSRNYLIENFPNEFRHFVLRQKLGDTALYNSVLKDFVFQDGIVSWNPSSDVAHQMAMEMMPRQTIWNDYKNYAAITQEGNLASIVPISPQTTEMTLAENRLFYLNFPEALNEYNNEITPFENRDNVIITPTSEDVFIKKDGTIFEKVIEDTSFGKSVYMAVSSPINDGYLHTDNPGAPKNQPTLTSVRASYNIGVEQSKGQINKLSSKEKSKIDKKIDEC